MVSILNAGLGTAPALMVNVLVAAELKVTVIPVAAAVCFIYKELTEGLISRFTTASASKIAFCVVPGVEAPPAPPLVSDQLAVDDQFAPLGPTQYLSD